MNSMEQKRSDFALQQINAGMNGTNSISSDLATFIVGTPTMILQNGLGQTMAFLLAKCPGEQHSGNKHYFTFNAIAQWIRQINKKISTEPMDFFNSVSNLDQQDYLKLQDEALKMLQWLKRYAKAFQKGE
ncbi:MAG: type III-B CRISPR module-associated protein Cmr5 [Desulfotignum sp.]|nr:type III-B CRISPR module-associated protein Cmr5 [Desulfotignum sp.]